MKGWLETNSDYAVFTAACFILFGCAEFWLRQRKERGQLPVLVWPSLVLLLAGGFFLVRAGGRMEKSRIQEFLHGVAPTYAGEIERLGHSSISVDTPANDPVYLQIVDAISRWKKLNPVIADIYTYNAVDGRVRLLVSGPTDYNRDGIISGEREQRVEIGTEYEEADPPMFEALTGSATFSDEPVRDEWGNWVSAQVPLHAEDGTIKGALGVDYPAEKWLEAIATGRRGMIWLLSIPVLMLACAGTVVSILRSELVARRRVELSLQESETRLRSLFEHLPFPFWVVDADGCCRLSNQAAMRAYGLKNGDPLPDDCRRRDGGGSSSGDSEEIEREHAGDLRYFYRVRSPLTAGKLSGGEVCVDLDMTGHRLAEQALRESQQRLARHVSQTPLAIIEWNTNYQVLSWNPAAERIFGYPENEAIGKNLLELVVAPSERAIALGEFNRMISGNSTGRVTLTNRTHKGGIIQCDWHSTALLDGSGRLINVASHAEDITERSNMERRLHDNRNMESLGQLAGGVAHEFNNLLTPMLIQIGIIEQTRSEDQSLRELIKPLESSVMQAAQLTQRVLSVGRKINEEQELFIINDLVADTISLLRKTLDPRIELRIELDTKLPAIWISRAAVTQIMINLLLNAQDTLLVKMENPPRSNWQAYILVRTHQTQLSDEGTSAQFITVSDNGMGMDHEQRDRIFEPFFTTKPTGSGTGLGLAVVWNAMKGFGGSVEVKSVLGAGSSFQVMVPRRRRTDTPAPVTNPLSTPPFVQPTANLTVPSAPVPLRVLLVDDTPMVVDSIRAVLVAGGHQITCAADGEEGWAQYVEANGGFDLVISDLNMPRLSGEDLLVRVRDHSKRTGVIILSGRLEPEQETRLRSHGADRVLRKPIRPVDLLVAVTTVGAEVRRGRGQVAQA